MPQCAGCKAPTCWTEKTKLEQTLIVSVIVISAFALAVSCALLATVLIQKEKDKENEAKSSKNVDVCLTESCISFANTILENMDSKVNPCENFYNFACGKFLKKAIPVDVGMLKVLLLLNDQVKEEIKNVLEEPPQKGETKVFKLMKKFYKTCMDTDAVEKDGLQTIRSILKDDLGGWPILEGANWVESKFDWKEMSSKFQKIGFKNNPFFQVFVVVHMRNSNRRVLCITDNSNTLRYGFRNKREVEPDPGVAYYNYIVGAAALLGANISKPESIAEINDMAKFQATLMGLPAPGNDPVEEMTVNQLQQKIPNIAWVDYINKLLAPHHVSITGDDVVFVYKQNYLKNLISFLTTAPKRTLANYMLWEFINDCNAYLNKAIRDAHLKYLAVNTGVANHSARWSQCVDNFIEIKGDDSIESESLYIGSGALFARKYFDKVTKQDAQEMFLNLHHTFQDIMKNKKWMDIKTKNSALDKLKAMIINTAYPDEFLDDKKLEGFYGDLNLDDNNYLKSILKLNQFDIRNHYRRLREPIQRNNWVKIGLVNRVNAFYIREDNSVNCPAAILQKEMYSRDRPHYLNYAAIGSIVGHEMSHGFDSTGSTYDKNGNRVNWWSSESKNIFNQKSQCFVEQYNKYVVPDLNKPVNGTRTLPENIADNGGIAVAYKAYQDWVKKHGAEKKLPSLNYTQNQLFWMALANVWCSKETIQIQESFRVHDSHAPERFRIIGSLSNNEDFSKDFGCSSRSKMNPKNKCKLW